MGFGRMWLNLAWLVAVRASVVGPHDDVALLQVKTAVIGDTPDPGAKGSTPGRMLSRPLACLRETTPSLELLYPADAETHFKEVKQIMAFWAQRDPPEQMAQHDPTHGSHFMHCSYGYCGPWVENVWIQHFERLWADRAAGTRLSDLFGPYIPIFLPWVDQWVRKGRFKYPAGFVKALKQALRPDVLYITVSQNAEGIVGHNEFNMSEFPNVLVLSAGGYGHVPIPLLKQFEPLMENRTRQLHMSFLGNPGSSHVREIMRNSVMQEAESLGIQDKVFFGKTVLWRNIMANSRTCLCPRGFGRTSFHLYESLQMGCVPIHVYEDIPWIPYGKLFESSLGFVTSTDGLPSLLQKVSRMSDRDLEKTESAIRSRLQSHYTLDGVMEQISRFMTGKRGGGDLVCGKLPKTPRGNVNASSNHRRRRQKKTKRNNI